MIGAAARTMVVNDLCPGSCDGVDTD